jgi:hypothetical protein
VNQITALSEGERKLAIMMLEIGNFVGLAEPQPGQMLQLQEIVYGRPVRHTDHLDHLPAISG